jgi:hypothetical protein
MAIRRRFAVALILVVTGAAQVRSQTPPPPPSQQQQTPPQQPTTTVVGPEGRLVSLIFPRTDAENVTRRIYDALRAREPEPQEFAESVAELQRGQLQQRLAAMVQQPEFASRAGAATPAQMLDQVFQGMLDRAPSAAEQKAYLPQIQARQYAPAMVKLITSDSFRQQAARDRATAAAGAPTPATPTPPPVTGRPTGSPPPASTAPPTPRVTVPPPPPLPPVSAPPSTPPAGAGQTPPAGSASPPPQPSQLPAARPPLRPAPFPTARNSEAAMPLAAPPRLTPEWARVLACQEQVVAQVRAGQADLVLLRFDAAEISASTVRGNAVDAFDDDRRLSYRCTGTQATYNYLDIRASRTTAPEDFPFEEVKACHTAVIAALKRNRRGAAVSFETAGMMPTDSLLFVRGAGIDQTKAGQIQPFTYQCQWDGDRILSATFTPTSR